jgi:hypothetical protein
MGRAKTVECELAGRGIVEASAALFEEVRTISRKLRASSKAGESRFFRIGINV